MDNSYNVKVVGELRVPWVPEHCIEDKLKLESDLRKTLALPILYMQRLQCVRIPQHLRRDNSPQTGRR